MSVRFHVSAQRGKSADYTFYQGPNIDDAYAELLKARESVKAASSGHVYFSAYDVDLDHHITIVFEEVGK